MFVCDHWYHSRIHARCTDTYNFHNIAINVPIYIMCNCVHDGIGSSVLCGCVWMWGVGFVCTNFKLRPFAIDRMFKSEQHIKLTGIRFGLQLKCYIQSTHMHTDLSELTSMFLFFPFEFHPLSLPSKLLLVLPCALNCCNYWLLFFFKWSKITNFR